MKPRHSWRRPNPQITAEAADWFVDFRTGDVDTRAAREAFEAWLRRSPEHIQAYLEIARLYVEFTPAGSDGQLDVEQLVASARADVGADLVRWESAVTPRPARRRVGVRAARFALVAPVLVAVAVCVGEWRLRGNYSTAIGEQRSIVLEDGSTVELNAHTRIRVRFSAHERHVAILGGQALFQVAHDVARPFMVDSAGLHVRAIGTQFDVNHKPSATTVTVIEGRVAVGKVLLAAGEQLTVTPQAVQSPRRADIAATLAWTHRSLIFKNTPLREVAAEFNRYSRRALIVEPGRLDDFHVSGTYSSNRPESFLRFLRFLRAQPGLRIVETGSEIRISQQ